MPQYKRANVSIHAPWWDDDEHVILRGKKTFPIALKAQTKAVRFPDGVDPSTLTEDEMGQYIDPAVVATETMKGMIVAWTLRAHPTPEQAERGERGDLLPLCAEEIEDLDEESGAFISNEIDKLGGSYKPEGMTQATFPGGTGSAGEGAGPALADQP